METTKPRIAVTDKFLAFGFGVSFLIVLIVIALLKPEPSGFSYTVFRIVLALAAGGIGAVLPGFIEVSFRNTLRAGGAVALFVVVYFFAPAPIDTPPAPPPREAARPVADNFLKLLDEGEYQAAYDGMTTSFKAQYPFSDMRELIKGERDVLGQVVSRKYDATSMALNPPGSAKGHYISFGFRTKFKNEPRTIFESVTVFSENGKWKPVAFFTYVKSPAGQFVSYDPDDSLPPPKAEVEPKS